MTSRREWLPRGLELTGLLALALEQPVLELLARQPTFFVAHGTRPPVLALFVALVALGPPVLGFGLALATTAAPEEAGRRAHLAALATAAAALALLPLKRIGLGSAAPLVALAAGGLLAVATARWRELRVGLALAAASAVLVPASFLLDADVRPLWSPPRRLHAEVRPARPAPIVFVVLDELPLSSLLTAPGRIDGERFPGFAALAEASTWYAGALSSSTATHLAVPSLLTGIPPDPSASGRAPAAAAHQASLCALLAAAYDVQAWESVTALCPPGTRPLGAARPAAGVLSLLADAGLVWAHVVAPPAAAARLPPLTGRWAGFWGAAEPAPTADTFDAMRDATAAFRELGRPLERTERPPFRFAQLLLPHMPHMLLPTGQRYAVTWDEQPAVWPADGAAAELAEQRHLLQVGATDTLLLDLLRRLRQSGRWDELLLVVTADHGVAYRPGSASRLAEDDTLGDLAPVPLFIKAPGQRAGAREDRPLETAQVLPIIAELIGLELPPAALAIARGVGEDGRASRGILHEDGSIYRYADAGPALTEAVRRKVERYGTGSFARVLAGGAHGGLVGRRVDALRIDAGSSRAALLDQSTALAEVRIDGPFLPALVSGTVTPPAKRLAIALNGEVAAVRPGGLDGRFRALLPWWRFRDGANELRIFAVEGPGERLAEFTLRGPVGRLEGDRLRLGDRVVRLRPAEGRGRLDRLERIERLEGRRFVYGWAFAAGLGRAAEVVVFEGGRMTARAPVGVRRFDLAATRGPEFEYSGFALDLPAGATPGTDLRVVALWPTGEAFELEPPRRPAGG